MKYIIHKVAVRLKEYGVRRSERAVIGELLKKVKSGNTLKVYPVDEYPPALKKYGMWKNSDMLWLNFYYSVYGKPDPFFISVPAYYYIETCLNDRLLTYAVKEKNFYDKFLCDIPTPRTVLRRINGFYYDERFQNLQNNDDLSRILKTTGKVIIKPSIESGGGNSILLFEKRDGVLQNENRTLDAGFLNGYRNDFIIQEFVTQHNFFAQFNPSGNSTVRVLTYRSVRDDSVHILHSLIRIGAAGNYLDHDHLGGVVASINKDDYLNQYAVDIYGNKYVTVNNIDLSTTGKVPSMDRVRALAREIAGRIYYGRILALDFTINSDGEPLLLDLNCWRNGINQYQMHNGGLFGEFTGEILEHCKNTKPRYVFTY
jgi:hypothetical protein